MHVFFSFFCVAFDLSLLQGQYFPPTLVSDTATEADLRMVCQGTH